MCLCGCPAKTTPHNRQNAKSKIEDSLETKCCRGPPQRSDHWGSNNNQYSQKRAVWWVCYMPVSPLLNIKELIPQLVVSYCLLNKTQRGHNQQTRTILARHQSVYSSSKCHDGHVTCLRSYTWRAHLSCYFVWLAEARVYDSFHILWHICLSGFMISSWLLGCTPSMLHVAWKHDWQSPDYKAYHVRLTGIISVS